MNDNYDDSMEAIPDLDEHYDSLVDFLRNHRDMKKTAVQSAKQGLLAGAGAVTGGLLLGPLGGLVGGVLGSCYGFYQAPDYNGMIQHIGDLPEARRQHLLQQVRLSLIHAGADTREAFTNPSQFQTALVTFAAQPQVRNEIWKYCVEALNE